MTRFFTELRRRRILPVAGAYLAAGFLAVEIVQFLLAQGNAPEWTSKLIAIAYVVGFPIAVFLAWVVQLDEEGVHRWDTPADLDRADGASRLADYPGRRTEARV